MLRTKSFGTRYDHEVVRKYSGAEFDLQVRWLQRSGGTAFCRGDFREPSFFAASARRLALTFTANCETLVPQVVAVPNGEIQPTISSLIEASERGDKAATNALFDALYAELHRMGKRELARRAGSVTLSATTLLHEAYLAMAARDGPIFPDRARFMGYASRVMRTLIIDHVRERRAQKRGGQFEITALDTTTIERAVGDRQIEEIGEALDELAKVEPALAELVDLKFFCGLSFGEIAALRDVSERTVQRNWERARIYLHRQIRADLPV